MAKTKEELIAEMEAMQQALAEANAKNEELEAKNAELQADKEETVVPEAPAAEPMYKIRIPLIPNTSNPDVYVSVNDRDWLIKPGAEVEVPACVMEVLKRKADTDYAIIQKLEAMQGEADKM